MKNQPDRCSSFALDRISQLSDGRIAYRLKYPTRGATHRIMTPVEFIARLAALIPPPRYPLVRYSGVLAPHSKFCAIIERATITKILEHLGMPVDPPPVKRGRDPTCSEAPPIGADM
ncbi:transposase [Sorangium sp. So ce1128]